MFKNQSEKENIYMQGRRMGPALKGIIIFAVAAALFFGFVKYKHMIIPEGRQTKSILSDDTKKAVKDGTKVYSICVVTWPGYAGAQLFNNGFSANKDSEYYKKYGIMVDFKIIDDLKPSRDAFIDGKCDLLWMTFDSMSPEADSLAKVGAEAVWGADKSRGGDVVVVTHDIKTINDLAGQPVAFAQASPSNSYLLILLKAAGKEWSFIKPVAVDSAITAAKYFQDGKVKAAIVWSPDDETCVSKVPGARKFASTKTHTDVISDGFWAKKENVEANFNDFVNIYRGWMIGNARINSSSEQKIKAAKILSSGLNISEGDAMNALDKVRLLTHGDNINLFGMNSSFTGITADDLYSNTARIYEAIGYASNSPSWRTVSTNKIIAAASDLTSEPGQNAEGQMKFTAASPSLLNEPVIASQAVSITFNTGSSEIDDNGKVILQIAVGETLRKLS